MRDFYFVLKSIILMLSLTERTAQNCLGSEDSLGHRVSTGWW